MTLPIITFAAGGIVGYLINEIANSRRISLLEMLIRQKRIIKGPDMWVSTDHPPIPAPRAQAPRVEQTAVETLQVLQARVDERRVRPKTDIFKAERERLREIKRQAERPRFDIKHDLNLDL